MFTEIEYLRDNLETPARGQAVREVKARITALIDAGEWDNADTFFREYSDDFNGNTSVLNIISAEFSSLIDAQMALPSEFQTTIRLNHLTSLYWFNGMNNSTFKRGQIAERMAEFEQDIIGIAKLQEARGLYRRAHRSEDASRVQRRLTDAVKGMKMIPPHGIPEDNPIAVELRAATERALKGWNEAGNKIKFHMLAVDFAGICPPPFTPELVPATSIFTSGALDDSGVIQSIGYSSVDGRINSGRMASTPERIHYHTHECIGKGDGLKYST